MPPAEVGITIETKFFTKIFAKICVRQEQMRAAAVKLFFFCFYTNFKLFSHIFLRKREEVGDFSSFHEFVKIHEISYFRLNGKTHFSYSPNCNLYLTAGRRAHYLAIGQKPQIIYATPKGRYTLLATK